jgi:hypothetical protein
MLGEVQLEQMLSNALFAVCPAGLRREVEEEVELIIQRYAPERSSAQLLAAAAALEAPADFPPQSRTRLRLWAAALREKAQTADDGAPGAAGLGRQKPG